MIIRGESVVETATLTSTRELHFAASSVAAPSFFEEACEQAFHRGEQQGKRQGYELALLELKSLLHILQTLSNKFLEYKSRLIEQLKPEVVEFAISVCERIIRKELSHPESLVKLINSLLSHAASSIRSDVVHLILSPEDLVMLENHLASIQYDKREIEGINFRANALLNPGDCRIETSTALLNYTLTRQLADLQAKVLQG